MKQVRVAVVGSRTIQDKEFVFQQLDYYLSRLMKDYKVIIVSGGADGIDKLSEKFAEERKLKTEIYFPDWDLHGKSAGFLRNTQIVEKSDYLIAITTGSKGTQDTINKAIKRGMPIKIINYANNIQ
jgi:hypothetical protein